MASQDVPDYLNLDGFETQSVTLEREKNRQESGEESDEDASLVEFVEVEFADPSCPECGAGPSDLKSNGYNGERKVKDAPNRDGHRTVLVWRPRRWICPECGGFTERPKGIPARKHRTKRLSRFVEKRAIRPDRSFVSISEEAGIDDGTVKNIFEEYVERCDDEVGKLLAPRVLGIDEVYVGKEYRAIVADVEEGTVLDFFESRKKDYLEGRLFRRLKDLHRVEVITMDMWGPYYELAQSKIFRKDFQRGKDSPHIVVDKFHIVKKANEAMDEAISKVGKTRPDLKEYLKRIKPLLRTHFPEVKQPDLWGWEGAIGRKNHRLLKKTYDIKKEFIDIFRTKGEKHGEALRRRAEKSLDCWVEKAERWQGEIKETLEFDFEDPLFGSILRIWGEEEASKWKEGILNYFRHNQTNALLEGLNSIVRATEQMGRHYTFPILRGKILYGLSRSRRQTLVEEAQGRKIPTRGDALADSLYFPDQQKETYRMEDRGIPFSEIHEMARLLGVEAKREKSFSE